MMNAKMTVERREHERFETRDGAFILLGPDSTKLGRLIDISMGGLAFSHVARTRPPDELFELDLFLVEGDFYLDKVPYEIISDFKTYDNHFGSITMRRCGVQFGSLTQSQISELEYFIQNHTTGEVQV
ncbi:MAG: PilZ domain-containing protein [Desulfobacterales bacterium]|nr:MAG: PilZ domain-containing protein [Desulfobacterales bacterium]